MEQKRLHAAIAAVASVFVCMALSLACTTTEARQPDSEKLPTPRQVHRLQKFWQDVQKEQVPIQNPGFYPSAWPNYIAYRDSVNLNSTLVLKREFNVDATKENSSSGDPELDAIVRHIVDRVTGRDENALRKAYEFVSYYDYKYESTDPKGDWRVWSRLYAKQMYKEYKGNCYRYASLMCWIARQLGYEARTVSGEVLQSSSLGYQAHGWCEVNQGGRWYIVDPDLHKFIPSRNFFMVTVENGPIKYMVQ